MRVDLNCDLGEGYGPWAMGDDAAMLGLVTSANVACGFHAGDPDVMVRTCRLARERGVSVGAHPGYADLQGFGRRAFPLSVSEIEAIVAYQVGAFIGAARLAGHRCTHVKAHGALSNVGCEDAAVAGAVARAIRAVDPALVFVVLPLTELERAGVAEGLALAREVFADRAYEDDGRLLSRSKQGAVLHDPEAVAARVLAMVREGAVPTASGGRLRVPVDTVCIHGDTPGAVAIARAVRAALEGAGVVIAPFAGS